MTVALIVDIVRSRELADRRSAQSAVESAFALSETVVKFTRSLWATAGDEFQAVLPHADAALRATTIVRLALPPEVDCRFGLGEGEIRAIDEDAGAPIQDGTAWYRARESIVEAHRREDRANPYLRSWFTSGDAERDALVNSFLLVRDHTITGMGARERRLTAGALTGLSQSELARREGISQSAVSQSLRRSGGAALVAASRLREDGQG